MQTFLLAALLLATSLAVSAEPARATIVGAFTLPRTNLAGFGTRSNPAADLLRAAGNGLRFMDLPSIGSGLARAGDHEFWGITDRGPNGVVRTAGGSRRTFPWPKFCPALVRYSATNGELRLTRVIPLLDRRGIPVSGLSNGAGEERLFESGEAAQPLPFDENGVDPEAVRVLPDGRFLVSEEYSPSILVVDARGEILVRYTPTSKPLTNATYLVKAVLPDVFAQRRANHGFESLAVSPDGSSAYAILQSPMGDEADERFARGRRLRALKLDLQQPLDAKVVGEFLIEETAAKEYGAKAKQEKISWSDADWIAPDTLVAVERSKGEARLLLVNLAGATNLLGRKEEGRLVFENADADLKMLGVTAAATRELFSTRELPEIDSDKIEGVVVLDQNTVVLANDNDFGLGDNETAEPSKLWIVHLAEPLPLLQAR